MKFTLDT